MKIPTSTTNPRQHPAGIAFLVTLFVAVLLIAGCAAPNSGILPPDAATPYASTQLNEGDVIQIAFPGATNLNTVLKVPVGGSVKLAFAGDFKASGKTPQELQDDILSVYGAQLQLKEVTVTLVSSAAAVFVSGEVLRPGKLPLDRPLTVMEAIMECGGFTPTARPNKVRVIRNEGGVQSPYDVDLSKALKGETSTPFYLRPNDVVNVPRKVVNI